MPRLKHRNFITFLLFSNLSTGSKSRNVLSTKSSLSPIKLFNLNSLNIFVLSLKSLLTAAHDPLRVLLYFVLLSHHVSISLTDLFLIMLLSYGINYQQKCAFSLVLKSLVEILLLFLLLNFIHVLKLISFTNPSPLEVFSSP